MLCQHLSSIECKMIAVDLAKNQKMETVNYLVVSLCNEGVSKVYDFCEWFQMLNSELPKEDLLKTICNRSGNRQACSAYYTLNTKIPYSKKSKIHLKNVTSLCQDGFITGCMHAASIYLAQKNDEKAVEYYLKGCEAKVAAGCSILSSIYEEMKDKRKSEEYLLKACSLDKKYCR